MKTVLITGTSSGFGLLSTIILAKKGYHVIATMRDIKKQDQLLSLAQQDQVVERITVIQMDVTKREEVESAYLFVNKRWGKLDVLINNAGYALGGFLEELSEEDWYRQFETNFFGVVRVTKTFLPLLKKNGGGKIINISSISGYFGFPGLGPYVASKHALEGFSESLRFELLDENVFVSLVEPASYKTKIWEKGLATLDLQKERPVFQQRLIKQAMRNITTSADPEEVTHVISRICEAEKPRLRYPVGKGAKPLYHIKSILPWSLVERIVQNRLKG